ncbi:hypothetical protein S40288_10392, partial [Stachybotrys chartarum IBT 40288]
SEFILVVDGGAGTWDLSAVTVGRANGKQRFTVKATAGNNHLGGLDVDQALRDIVLKRAGRRVSTPSSLSNLLSKCEGAKIRMSQQALAEPSIPVICDDGTRVVVKLTHEDFDQACSVLRHGVEDLFKEIFRRDATMMERIEAIALNGGSSYLPCIRALCQSYLPNIPMIQRDGDTAVAFGASLFGSDSSIEVMDVLPKSIGVLTRDDKTDKLQVCIIARRNMQLPIHCSKRLFTPKENCGKVRFSLVESESSDPKQSTLIGVFSIDISACGETTDIDTTIDITMDNIVHGRAVIDGHEGELTITCPEKFTPDRRQALHKTTQSRLAGGEARGAHILEDDEVYEIEDSACEDSAWDESESDDSEAEDSEAEDSEADNSAEGNHADEQNQPKQRKRAVDEDSVQEEMQQKKPRLAVKR